MSFDPEAYDPFCGYSKYREIHQRINAVHRENQLTGRSNQPLVVDWTEVDVMTREILHNGIQQTRDANKCKLAASTVECHLDWGERIDGPCILLGFDTRVSFPLPELNDVVNKYFSDRYTDCDVEVSYGCQQHNANHLLGVGVGDYLCLYKVCRTCRDWFDDPNPYDMKLDWPLHHPFDDRHPATFGGD